MLTWQKMFIAKLEMLVPYALLFILFPEKKLNNTVHENHVFCFYRIWAAELITIRLLYVHKK